MKKIKNKTTPIIIALILAFIGSSCNDKEVVGNTQPNIIVILADDMRSDYLGSMGKNDIVQTPNLDALAEKGILFENTFATSASCTPNRTCLLSGMYERKHGVTFASRSAMTEEAFSRTYPMQLKKAGYYTGYVGKNHTPIGKSEKGFGYKSGRMEEMFDYWYAGHGHLTFYPKERHDIFANAKADNQPNIIQEGVDNFFEQDPGFAGAKSFLQSRPKDKSFCLLVNFNVPHSSGTGSMELRPEDPELYKSVYRDRIAEMPQPPTYVAHEEISTPKLPVNVYNGKYIKSYNFVKTPDDLRERQVRTCQTVTGIDMLTGKVIKELEKQGIADNTIIIFTSDHGLQHGEHGLGGKMLLYEESISVPLIIYAPGLSNGTIDELCLSIDLAPTILELAGIDADPEMQGISLLPLMKEEKTEWREDLFCENMFMGQNYPRIEAVRSKEWKYIRYYSKDNDQHHILSLISPLLGEKAVYEELYDLRNDPSETKNVADEPANSEILDKLRGRCDKLLKEAKGNARLPDTYIQDKKNPDIVTQAENKYQELVTIYK
ncbi:MAG: sulfatase-like hydrolase/transferase [Bacteroidota bacterium]